jgi:2,5-diamino-6-(ribosylamino)-4(3H)-pyrimidinone 5'-phosphate reductase
MNADYMERARARPIVVINTAITVDGKIDTIARQGAVLSSLADGERVDRLRADVDAVMVGGHTLLGDDPRLLVKSAHLREQRLSRGLSENPIKVALDSRMALRLDSRFLTTGSARRIVFTTQQAPTGQIETVRQHGAEVYVLGETQVDLALALAMLKTIGVQRLLVEGGATLNFELLRLGLVDEVQIYLAPLIVGGASAPTLAAGDGLPRDQAIQLRRIALEPHNDGGVVIRYQVVEAS